MFGNAYAKREKKLDCQTWSKKYWPWPVFSRSNFELAFLYIVPIWQYKEPSFFKVQGRNQHKLSLQISAKSSSTWQ